MFATLPLLLALNFGAPHGGVFPPPRSLPPSSLPGNTLGTGSTVGGSTSPTPGGPSTPGGPTPAGGPVYGGPGDTPPGSPGETSGGSPPPEAGSGGGGAPGAPPPAPSSGGGSGPSGPPLPPPTAPGTGLAGLGPGPLSGGAGTQTDFTGWTWWWFFNREPYLDLRNRLSSTSVLSGSDGFFLGRGYKRQHSRDSLRPSDVEIRDTVLPALLRALETTRSNSVTTGAIIALARIGEDQPREARGRVDSALRGFLQDRNQEISETTAVALGILAHDASAPLLSDLLLDTHAGRKAVATTGEVPTRTRAFAAYGLGLLAHQSENEDVRRFAVHSLARALDEDDSASADIGVACVIALGRISLLAGDEPLAGKRSKSVAPATSSHEAQVQHLLRVLRDRDQHRLVRAHVPVSLGFLVAAQPLANVELKERVAEALLDLLFSNQGEPRQLKQSCATALGMIADNDEDDVDARIREALRAVDRSIQDRQVRHLALIASARAGARFSGTGDASSKGVEETREYLLGRLTRGRSDSRRWAALALAVFERALEDEGFPRSEDSLRALRRSLTLAASPLDLGAHAIACGVARDLASADPMLEHFGDQSEEETLGHLGVGLGLLESTASLVPIRERLEEATYRPTLLFELATALGLLGDRHAVGILTGKLEKAKSQAAQASVAKALGRIGDARSVAPLVEMLENERLTDDARAFAAVALGIVGDRDELPWNTILSLDTNYNAAPPTLFDSEGFGVLNIL